MWTTKLLGVTTTREGWQENGLKLACVALQKRSLSWLSLLWVRSWMRHADHTFRGRLATRLATIFPLPYATYYHRAFLSELHPRGFIAPSAELHHSDLRLGPHVFVGDRVLILQDLGGGRVELGERVRVRPEAVLQTGNGGRITIGPRTWVGPRSQFMAYKGDIVLGSRVLIGPNCSFYPYDHGTDPDRPIDAQDLQTHGPIVVEDGAWLGANVTVLSGVHIGCGAVIGAASVVTRDVPPGSIAVGVPARVVKQRGSSTTPFAPHEAA